jgi:DNA-binding transcriptional ArsR family regulator
MITDMTELTEDAAGALADMFRLLGDANRLRIVSLLLAGATPVGAIAQRLSMSPSLVSHHLRLLRAGRIVAATRRGREVHYRAADPHIERVVADMIAHVHESIPAAAPGSR